MELLRAVCGQFSFRQFLVPSYTSQDLQALSIVFSVNNRDFNLLHLSLLEWLPVLSLFWLQVSSVSNFRPDRRGQRWSLIQANLFVCAVGREEHCKQISLACVGSGLPLLTECVLSQSTLLRLQVALRGTGPGLCALPRSKPLWFRFSGTPQRHRLGWACVFRPSQVRAAQVARCLASTVAPS